MKSIELASLKGKTEVSFGVIPPSNDIMNRLKQEGYWFYSIADNFMCPKIYGVSWKKEERKKKWYHKIFSTKKEREDNLVII